MMKKYMLIVVSLLITATVFNSGLFAAGTKKQAFALAKIFSNNMVLQQGKKVPVWGFASEGTKVEVSINGKSAKAETKNGKWMAYLPSMEYGGPYKLKVKTSGKTITLKNVMIGEVWIASGQSNMAWQLLKAKNGKQEVAEANHPEIRIFKVGTNLEKTEALDDLASCQQWDLCTPKSAANFSAVAYFFGRELQNNKKVAIGLIKTAVGGTKAELWISKDKCPPFKGRKNRRGIIKGPGFHYKAMINPLIPFACRGFIWYQGESNAADKEKYQKTFEVLINDWRERWGEELPFLFVQLANFKAHSKERFDGPWARLREAQFKTLQLPKTGMVTTIDIGNPDNIHPKNKQEVGRRLALVAEHVAYGNNKVVYSGPVFREFKIKENKMEISFDHIGSGLKSKTPLLKGFAIAGKDKKFSVAKAKIKSDRVIVWNDSIAKPVYVRYAFSNNPEVSLYNKEGLPALPFRSDAPAHVTENDNADGVSAGVHDYEDPTKGRDLTSRKKRTLIKYTLPKELKDGINIASLEDAECDKGAIMNLVQNIEKGKYDKIDSLLIVHKGKLILEEYFNSGKIEQPHLQMSITKSVVACAMGKAIELGFVKSEDDLILDYLPSVDKSKLQPGVAKIRIKDILTMRSGLNYKEKNAKQKINRAKSRKEHINRILTKSQALTPGKVFKYKSTDPDLAGHIIANTTGMNVEQFVKTNIFNPMGIGPYAWSNSSSTLSKCAAGLDLRSRDMLKLGLMIRDNGRFNGKQILPEAWIKKMIKTQYKNPSYPHSYGYFWWTHSFNVGGKKLFCHSARGALGQFIYYVPSIDLLVVFTSTNRKNMKLPFQIMEQELLPAFLHPDKNTVFTPTAIKTKPISPASEAIKQKGNILYEDNMRQGWKLRKSKFTSGKATVKLSSEAKIDLSVKPIGDKFLFVTLRKKIKPTIIIPGNFEIKLKFKYNGSINAISVALFGEGRLSQSKAISLANIPKDGQWHEVLIKSQHLRSRPKGRKVKKLIRIIFGIGSKKPVSGTIKFGKLQIRSVH